MPRTQPRFLRGNDTAPLNGALGNPARSLPPRGPSLPRNGEVTGIFHYSHVFTVKLSHEISYCGLAWEESIKDLHFSPTLKYTGDSKPKRLMAEFYKIRTAHSIMNKGFINIISIVFSLFFPQKNSMSPCGNLRKVSSETKVLASLHSSPAAFFFFFFQRCFSKAEKFSKEKIAWRSVVATRTQRPIFISGKSDFRRIAIGKWD